MYMYMYAVVMYMYYIVCSVLWGFLCGQVIVSYLKCSSD